MRLCAIPAILCLAIVFFSCKKDPKSVSELARKVWVVQTAEENGTLVYTAGVPGSIRDYSNFQLDLSDVTIVRLKETDNSNSTGEWTVEDSKLLVLKNLTPQSTGTGGTISYVINSIDNTKLDISRQGTNLKTGNTTNRYVLIQK